MPSDTIAPIISKCIALLPINTVGRHLGEGGARTAYPLVIRTHMGRSDRRAQRVVVKAIKDIRLLTTDVLIWGVYLSKNVFSSFR